MDLIDRIFVSNQCFISSVLKKFADVRRLPDSAVSHMQLMGVVHELFEELGANDEMAGEYHDKVLRTLPPKYRERVALSGSLRTFLGNRVSPGLLHKYGLTENDLYSTWNFENLEDVSTLEHLDLGASTYCEHHSRWRKEQDEVSDSTAKSPDDKVAIKPDDEFSMKALDNEFAIKHSLDLELLHIDKPASKETDALLEL